MIENRDNLRLISDDYWKYKFTITTNNRFNEHTPIENNIKLMHYWILDKVIHFLSSTTKDIVNNKPRYKHRIKLKDLEKISSHILLFASFEPTSEDTGEYIHFHFISSRFIVPKNNDYTPLIESIEKDVFNVLYKQLNNYKKIEFIKDFELVPYITYKEYKKLVRTETVGDYRLYICKWIDNDKYPPFYSTKLTKLLNKAKGIINE